jgi:hypothetical protein
MHQKAEEETVKWVDGPPHRVPGEAPPPPGWRSSPPKRTPSDYATLLRRLEFEYRAFEARKDHDPDAAYNILSEFVAALRIQHHCSDRLFSVLAEIVEGAKHGTKHKTLRDDAPEKSRWHPEHWKALRIQAQAASVLQRALDVGEKEQKWMEKIAARLEEVGLERGRWGTRPPGPYVSENVRAWRKACLGGKHKAAGLFRILLDWERKLNLEPAELLYNLDGTPHPRIVGE